MKPFLTDFVDADSLDALPTTRAIKVLILKISETQDFVRAGIGVGPESDCLLLANGGVRDMNQEVAEADEQDARKKAEAETTPQPISTQQQVPRAHGK